MKERVTRRLQEWANGAELPVSKYNAVHRIADEIEHKCADRVDAAYAEGASDCRTAVRDMDADELRWLGLMRVPKDAEGCDWFPGDATDDGHVVLGVGNEHVYLGGNDDGIESCKAAYVRHGQLTPYGRLCNLRDSMKFTSGPIDHWRVRDWAGELEDIIVGVKSERGYH